MSRIIIVGAGHAGLTVAKELLTLRPGTALSVVTADDGHQYPKPQLSTSLRLGKQPDALIVQRAEALAQRGMEMIPRTRVTGIHADEKRLRLHDGRTLDYDRLVLAIGASPFIPPMEGSTEHVLTINHLDDYRRFRNRLVPDRPVVIIGGGLIGMEFAADLTSVGYRVHVVDPGAAALPRLLPPVAAAALTDALSRQGVTFHWQRSVSRLEGGPGEFRATLSDGSVLSSGTVLSAVGLRPSLDLARAAGLPTARGILVDEHMRAAPDVYAVGDCVELPGELYLPFIKPITDTGKYVARRLAGKTEAPIALPNYAIAVKVPQWPVASSMPLPGEHGTWEESRDDEGTFSRLISPEGVVLRLVATGNRAPEVANHLAHLPPFRPSSAAAPGPRPQRV